MENLAQHSLHHEFSNWKTRALAGWAGARRFVSDARRRSAFRSEIAALERNGSLDAILDDLGLARWEVSRIATGYPEAQRLLPTMAYRRGVDLEKLDPQSLYALRHACSLCDSHRACRRWISGGAATGDASFCPNAKLFGALQNTESAL
jgi:hypothetical protein